MKTLRTIVVLAAVSGSALLAGGCADSGSKPYNLTGNQSLTPDQQRYIAQHSIDSRGRWNSVLAANAENNVRIANRASQ